MQVINSLAYKSKYRICSYDCLSRFKDIQSFQNYAIVRDSKKFRFLMRESFVILNNDPSLVKPMSLSFIFFQL